MADVIKTTIIIIIILLLINDIFFSEHVLPQMFDPAKINPASL